MPPLDIIMGGRGTGRTTKAVEWVMGTQGAVLIVMDEHERARIQKQYGLPPECLTTIERAKQMQGVMSANTKAVGIDNLEVLFARTVGRQPSFITMPLARVETLPMPPAESMLRQFSDINLINELARRIEGDR